MSDDIEKKVKTISEQLDLLVENKALTKEKRQDVIKELEALKADPGKSKEYKEYADSLSKGLPGVTKGVMEAIKAGTDPYAISTAAIDIFAGVMTMAGPLLGPLGTLASALAGLVSTILGAFLPKTESMSDQLEKLLDKFLAKQQLSDLGKAINQVSVVIKMIESNTLTYVPLNLQDGGQVDAMDAVWEWLSDEDKQSLPQWDKVLEKFCMLWIQILKYVILMMAKPSTLPKEKEKDGLLNTLGAFPVRMGDLLGYLESIKPVVEQRGLYAHVGSLRTGWVLYTAPGRRGSLSGYWKYESGAQWMKTISIHVPKGQVGSSNPRYDLYACVNSPIGITRYQLDSLGALSGGKQLMLEGNEYPNTTGGTRLFTKCVDARALPDWDDPKKTKVYTAHAAGAWHYVNIHVVDADNNVKRINWEPNTGPGLAQIRPVVGDITKSLPDDLDVAALPRHGLYEIIYGGYRGNRNLWVALDNSWTEVPSPWDTYRGIEVDPSYLWIFGERGIACATHASVIQCKKGESPRWIFYADLDKSLQEQLSNQPPVVDSLYPCADGTLAAMVNTEIFTASYKVDRASSRIETSSWLKRGGTGQQIVRMPIPCWPTVAGVMRDLETQLAEVKNGTWGGLQVPGVKEISAAAYRNARTLTQRRSGRHLRGVEKKAGSAGG